MKLRYLKRKQLLLFLSIFFISMMFILPGCISGIRIQTDFVFETVFEVDSPDTITCMAIRPLSGDDDQIFILFNPVENTTNKRDTREASPTGLYTIPSAIGGVFASEATLSNALLNSNEILIKNDLFFYLKDQIVGAVNEAGIPQWENSYSSENKTPLTMGFGVDDELTQQLGIIFENPGARNHEEIYSCEWYPLTGSENPLSETTVYTSGEVEALYGPFSVFERNLFLIKDEGWLINDSQGIFIETNITDTHTVLSVGSHWTSNQVEQLYVLFTDEDSIQELLYDETGTLVSQKQVLTSTQSIARDRDGLGEITANNPTTNKGNSIYTATDKGIPQIKQENNNPPPDEGEFQVEFAQQPPSQIEVEDCNNEECQVTLSIKANMPIKNQTVFIEKEDNSRVIKWPAGTDEGVTDGEYYYTLTFTIPSGKNTLDIAFSSSKGYKNLTCQIECICHPPYQAEWVQEPPAQLHNCVDDECEVNLTFKTTKSTVSIRSYMDDQVDGTLLEKTEDKVEGGFYFYTVTLKVPKGKHSFKFLLRSPNDDIVSLLFDIECVCPEEGVPEISWDPDKPPTDTTTEDTAKLNITSDKELDALKVTTNGQEQVTQNPEAEQDGDAFNYEATVELQDGDNAVEVQGENENGLSNLLQHDIQKGEPPVIDFAAQPQTPVTNCVEEECKVSISISCDNFDEIACQVGDGDSISYYYTDLSDDVQGNYPIPVTLQKGTNVITFTAKNEFGTSEPISCTIVCVCDSPSSGYTKEQTIGETEIPKPIGIDFYPDTTQQKNFLNVLTKTAENETEIQHGELTGVAFVNKYPNATLPANVGGYAFNGNDKTNLLLLPDQVKELESDGQTLNSLHVFPEGQNGQAGQLKFQDVDTSYITKTLTNIFYLNRNGAQVISSGNKIVGLDIMRDAYNNTALYEKTALGTVKKTGSDGRATEQSILTLANSGQVTELFDIPLSDGMIIDVITNVLDDNETVQFIVTTVKNETEYWVNIYNQAGERLYAFKTHDLNDLEQTSGETIFYQVVMASSWPDDKLYIIHSEFPGVQVWAPEE